MKILKIFTIEPIQSLGVNSSFTHNQVYSNGNTYPIEYDPEFKAIRIHNVLIPLSNIKEILFEKEEVIEQKQKTKKSNV